MSTAPPLQQPPRARPSSLLDPRDLSSLGNPTARQQQQQQIHNRRSLQERDLWRPSGVEEALSSMLWRPYDLTPSPTPPDSPERYSSLFASHLNNDNINNSNNNAPLGNSARCDSIHAMRAGNIAVSQLHGGGSSAKSNGASESYDMEGHAFSRHHRGNAPNDAITLVSRAKSAEPLLYRVAFDHPVQCQSVSVSPNDDKMRVTVPGASGNPDSVNIVTTGVSVSADNVCNVHVQGEDTASTVIVSQPRTFTSTEAQTDDVQGVATATCSTQPNGDTGPTQSLISREERRRERRERRHNRRMMISAHQHMLHGNVAQPQPAPPPVLAYATAVAPPPFPARRPVVPNEPEILPDILHSHVPPPYSTLPLGGVPVPIPGLDDMRYGFPVGIRRSISEPRGKGCCGLSGARPPLRALIAVVALGGVACALGGAALGALGLGGAPTSHLTAALLMIGVGVILVTVSGAAWRLTAPGTPPCRALLGFGGHSSGSLPQGDPSANNASSGGQLSGGGCGRRFSPRSAPPCGRSTHPYGAMMYPEFQHRQPPPSYQASMQEYRLRLLLLDRQNSAGRPPQGASPPPTYRSHAGSLLRAPLTSRCPAPGSEYSLPPSYRSRHAPARTTPSIGDSVSDLASVEHDNYILTDTRISTVTDISNELANLDAIKRDPEDITPLKMLLQNSDTIENNDDLKDGNLVTIVQTGEESGPVIVTVSGCSTVEHENSSQTEMDILAHL